MGEDDNLRDTGAKISTPRIEVKHGQVSGAQTLEALNVGAAKGAAPGEIRAAGLATKQKLVTLSNGANNDVAIAKDSFVRISGPTAPYSITGFDSGRDGALLFVENDTTQNMTMANQNVGSLAANRIVTQSGADVTLAGRSMAQLIYDSNASRWNLITVLANVALTSAKGNLASDISMALEGTYYDGPSVSLAAGTWFIVGTLTIASDVAGRITTKLWDGTTVESSTESTVPASGASGELSISMSGIVSPASTTTYKISAVANGGFPATYTMKAACLSGGTPGNASHIRAVKIA